MRTTELLCVFCLFMASAANECDGDASCIADKDDATLLQSSTKLLEASVAARSDEDEGDEDGEGGDEDGGDEDEDEEDEASGDGEGGDEDGGEGAGEGAGAGNWDPNGAAGADGGEGAGEGAGAGNWDPNGAGGGEDGGEGGGEGADDENWDPSSCSTELCTVCEACFATTYSTSSPFSTDFSAQCLGAEGGSHAEVCDQENTCITQGAQDMIACVAIATAGDAQAEGAPTLREIGNCMAEKMCQAETAKSCAVTTTVANNWHSTTCPGAGVLLERMNRSKQEKSVGQEISLDESLSGKRTC